MKKSVSVFMSACVLYIMTLQTSCVGSFKMTTGWWDNITSWDSKFGAGIVYLIIGGLVTGVTLFIDTVILNLIEFWSGNGPLGLEEGEMEQKVAMGQDGNMYEITATKNRFDIVQLTGDEQGATQALVYEPVSKTWFHEQGDVQTKLSQTTDNGQYIKVFGDNGAMAVVPANADKATAQRMVEAQM